jgi:hypothetical protein
LGPPPARARPQLPARCGRLVAEDHVVVERQRLLQQGFVRIDANGIFAADRYVTPEQIDSVTGDGLMLNVTKDELIKKH